MIVSNRRKLYTNVERDYSYIAKRKKNENKSIDVFVLTLGHLWPPSIVIVFFIRVGGFRTRCAHLG